jgi:hypothetical protein
LGFQYHSSYGGGCNLSNKKGGNSGTTIGICCGIPILIFLLIILAGLFDQDSQESRQTPATEKVQNPNFAGCLVKLYP